MLNKFFNKEKDYHQIFLEELYKKELDQNILRDLIFTNKVDINFQDNDQDSYLDLCIKKSKFKSVIWLIHNNINLKLKNKNGKNIFDISIEIHNHKIVEELLKTDQFDINKKDKYNRTLLQDMVVLGDNDMAQLLIKYGALLNSKDNHNRNVLFDAVSYGDIKFIEFLLTFQDLELNNIDDNGDTIMHHPFIKQNDEVAQMLISNGADTTIKDKDGKTYLCAAALRGMESYHLVDEALKSGANINSRVVNNNTILMELVSISSKIYKENQEKRESLIKMSKQLLKNGLDSNAIDDNGETALFRAVRVEDFELVTFLLSAGIDPNIQNNNSQSVLHLAIYQGINSLDIINCLLKYGANPLIKNKQNQTIYEILNDIILHTHGKKDIYDHFILARIKQDGQYMVVLESILSHNKADLNFQDSTGNPLFFNPLLNDHFSLFKLYIKNGLNIHNTNILNHNIFFEYVLNAFEQNKEDIDFQNNISMLISSKLNHNCQDETGWTIVHKILTKECNIHLFDILTQVVLFDYEITDKLGRSVIHNAVWGDQKSAMKRIHSIDKSIVNIADGYGILPITYAALLGSQDLVLLLISLGANVRSGLSISDSAIKKFSPLLKNLDSLKNNIKDDDMLRKMDIVIDQVKRDFNLI